MAKKDSSLFVRAKDVSEILQMSISTGHKTIAALNKELAEKGYIVHPGRVPRKYFYERFGLA